MFLNIHTHHAPLPGQWALVNVLKDFNAVPAIGLYSAGLHPWYLKKETMDAALQQLNQAMEKSNVLALGECGLDTVCDTDYELQQSCFRRQVQLANKARKPLILHCVKAFEDVIRILKEEQAAVPVIFHGYHKSKELAQQLVKAGYYISFGKHILQPVTATVFLSIPLNHVFLETDAADINIEALYQAAASIKQVPVRALEEQLSSNAGKLFGKINV
ncbi:MAG: TatD family hydrolase [Ferruginibacter sp.]